MKHLILATALALMAGAEIDVAPGTSSAIFEHLEGTWEGEGELMGRPASFAMKWERELGGRFMGLSYEIRGETQMEARAHYRVAEQDTVHGVWVDSRGEILELRATVSDSALTTIWQSPTERGRTIYRQTGVASVEVQDFFYTGTDWQLFGAATYARK